MQDIEGAGVKLIDLFVVRVAQELIQLVERFWNVGIADAVDDIHHIAGMAVHELDLVFFAIVRQRVDFRGEESDCGQGYIQEGVRQDVKPGVPMRGWLASIGSGNDYTGESQEGGDGYDHDAARVQKR
jgi:hypothetical protein